MHLWPELEQWCKHNYEVGTIERDKDIDAHVHVQSETNGCSSFSEQTNLASLGR
jgi:hypothetical protein